MSTAWIITTNRQIAALVALGRQVSQKLVVIALGDGPYPDADNVIGVQIPDGVPVEAMAPVVTGLVDAQPGDVILIPDRSPERVLGGAVAVALGAPVLSKVIGYADGSFAVARFGGIAIEKVATSAPVVAVLPGGAAVEATSASVTAAQGSGPYGARVIDQTVTAETVADLGAARKIVSVGRGLKAPGDLEVIESLAAALGAEVACSRPLAETVDWMPKSRYVGVSGHVVKPDCYIAVGISGQMQHMVGVKDSKTIVAINSDQNAPIFAQADYGVVGDLYEVLPALVNALK